MTEDKKLKDRIDWLEIWAAGAEARGRHSAARAYREEANALRLASAIGSFYARRAMIDAALEEKQP